MDIASMELVNVQMDTKEMIVQVFLDFKKNAKILVLLNAYNFVHMFIKQKDLLLQNCAMQLAIKNVLEIVLIQEVLLLKCRSQFLFVL